MPRHDYTPGEALGKLLAGLHGVSPSLDERVRVALDAGTEDVREEPIQTRGPGTRQRTRQYRKARPFTDEEAVTAALEVLRAHLIETRECVSSANKEFSLSKLGPPITESSVLSGSEDTTCLPAATDVTLVVEAEPETARPTGERKDVVLEPVPRDQLDEVKSLIKALVDLMSFREDNHGNAR